MYAEAHPLALNLDIDRIRDMLGQWRSNTHSAGLLARAITLAAARAHLLSGHDVVIPQFLGRLTFIEQAEGLARDTETSFHEIVLLDSKENSLRRYADRGIHDASPAELAEMYDRLLAVVAARPGAKLVSTRQNEIDQAYRDFFAAL